LKYLKGYRHAAASCERVQKFYLCVRNKQIRTGKKQRCENEAAEVKQPLNGRTQNIDIKNAAQCSGHQQ
jgi:hypothetical protein